MAVCQNLVPLVNIKIAGKWMFIPLKIYIGIDPYPFGGPENLSIPTLPTDFTGGERSTELSHGDHRENSTNQCYGHCARPT
jgi:hypothetical protein